PRPVRLTQPTFPRTDTGLFNLRLDGATQTANAACGTGTGKITSTVGLHTVAETAGTNTDLANYTSVIGGDCAANGNITLAAADDNTRSHAYTPVPPK